MNACTMVAYTYQWTAIGFFLNAGVE